MSSIAEWDPVPGGPAEQAALIEAELSTFAAALAQHWKEAPIPDDVAQALGCIHAHLFDERLNVAFVREQCGIHNHNISCRFKHHVGVGMRRYIECQRMWAVKHLLRYDDLRISDIAWAVGYTYLETFERAFRRCESCAPSQFRETGG